MSKKSVIPNIGQLIVEKIKESIISKDGLNIQVEWNEISDESKSISGNFFTLWKELINQMIKDNLWSLDKQSLVPLLKEAYTAGHIGRGLDFDVFTNKFFNGDFDEHPKEKIEYINIPFSWIDNNIGWSEFATKCDKNHWYIAEGGSTDPNEMFKITKTQAKAIGYIK